MMATAFKHHLETYPRFASQIIFELWRQGDRQYSNQTYIVRMRINDQNVTLSGACGENSDCDVSNFTELIKNISYYSNDI